MWKVFRLDFAVANTQRGGTKFWSGLPFALLWLSSWKRSASGLLQIQVSAERREWLAERSS